MTKNAAPSSRPCEVRAAVADFAPYTAGRSIDEIKEQYDLTQVVKLASNENPLGVSPVVQRVLREHAGMAFRYPRSGNTDLVRTLAEYHDIPADHIVVGNGSDEIIDLLIRVKAEPGKGNILTFKPCFSMYELQAKLCGVEMRQTPLNPDFTFPWDAYLSQADENTGLAFITSPDNPSGYAPPVTELEAAARSLPEQCLLVVDEAYMDFTHDQKKYSLLERLREFPNLVILRTFSKLFGLAGLRLGYGIMPPYLADYLWRVRLPFSVNIPAEVAGIAALRDDVFFRATYDATLAGRAYLTKELENLGFSVHPSQANFLMFQIPQDFALDAKGLFEELLKRGVIIRPLTSYGLPDRLRVSIGREDENRFFIRALQEIVNG